MERGLLPTRRSFELFDASATRSRARSSLGNLHSNASTVSWHPKLTLYRLLVITATVGLGIAKAATSYLNFTYASITLEWILGVVVVLFLHLLGTYENPKTRRLRWLFSVDYMEYLWKVLETFTSFKRPLYRSDEHDVWPVPWSVNPSRHRPPITAYRVLVTLIVSTFGVVKWALLIVGFQVEATTMECVFAVVIATCVYWLGLYEESAFRTYPSFFHVDYTDHLVFGLRQASSIGEFFLHLLGIAFASAWFVFASWFIIRMWVTNWLRSGTSYTAPELWTHMLILNLMALVAISAVFGAAVILNSMFVLYGGGTVSGVRYIARMAGYTEGLPPFLHLGERTSFALRVSFRHAVRTPFYAAVLSLFSFCTIACIWILVGCWSIFLDVLNAEWYFVCLFVIACLIAVPAALLVLFYIPLGFYNCLKAFCADFFTDGPDSIYLLAQKGNTRHQL
ncbi:hypothetical protein BDN70DRAFT_921893 [Pholiota conissans]|uniref:Uncharacterized protein n=1 Tax=Pholiota conissans TaxID=109636 RepID=A0A9P5YZ62_9AGAR|nr:hypothetical protein BDN70DRAFT_921893 [Pholiota conissans]